MPDSPQAGPPPRAGPDASLDERLRAVERALTETDRDLTGIADAAERTERLERLEERCGRLESRIDELEAAVDAVRGYVGAVRAVNRDVERRADAALAAARGGADGETSRAEAPPADGSRIGDDPSDGQSGSADDGSPADGATPSAADREHAADRTRSDRDPGAGDDGGPGPASFEAHSPDAPWTDRWETASPDDATGSDDPAPTDDARDGDRRGSADPDRRASTDPHEVPSTDGDPSGSSADPAGRDAGPIDVGWEPVEPADGSDGSVESTATPAGSDDRDREESAGETPDGDRRGSGTDEAPRGPRASPGEPGDPGHVRPGREATTDPSDRGGGGFEWPPRDGLDVDRAQPWSAPDLPAAENREEDRSLLERLREAL